MNILPMTVEELKKLEKELLTLYKKTLLHLEECRRRFESIYSTWSHEEWEKKSIEYNKNRDREYELECILRRIPGSMLQKGRKKRRKGGPRRAHY